MLPLISGMRSFLSFNICNDDFVDCILSHIPTVRLCCIQYTQTLQLPLSRDCFLIIFIPSPLISPFFFFVGVQLLFNIILALAVEQSELAPHRHISPLLWIPSHLGHTDY